MYRRVNELLGTKYKSDSEIDWIFISINYKLSESFIREFQDKVNWGWLSQYQLLSWDFILKFEDKVNWNVISSYQPFIDLTYKKINKEMVKENRLYYLYQKTRNRGWFLGYNYEKYFSLEINKYNFFFRMKVKISWKDLIKTNESSYYELIRQVKYV